MKIFVEKEKNIRNFMRKAGYKLLGQKDEELSFVRELGTFRYPRFHVYIKEKKDSFEINLHLDQKKPVYQRAHNAEYQGELVEKELARLKTFYEND
jgi:hypothetical protein